MRTFDLQQQFAAIKTAAVAAVKSIFPIEGKTRGIRLEGVSVEDNAAATDYDSQAKAKSRGATWGVPVYASLTLYDKASGKVLDRNAKVRLFLLPKITPRFSYIVGGNEYQVHNQLRLKSGVYTVKKQNSELKTSVNLAQGKNFELVLDPRRGTFTITKVAGGQAKIPLYPLLVHLGMSEQAIQSAWGQDLAAANKSTDPKIATRAAQAFGVRAGDIKDYFAKTKVDPEMTSLTLGSGFDKVSGPMLLAASKKLLEVHLGKSEPNDLNSLEYKEVHSLEDYIKERLEKNKDKLAFTIRRVIDNPRRVRISQIVNPGAFNSTIESFFTHDDKSATPEQTNPLEMLSGQYAATIMGAGGIKSEHAVTDDMREVHPTHYGFVDPVSTPESSRIGANLHLPLGVIKDGKTLKMIVRDSAGKMAALTPTQAYNAKIAYPGQTGDSLKVKHRGQTLTLPRKEVEYFTPNSDALFSWSTNLIPYLPSDQGNRAMMASKHMEQAVSLKHREAPLVQLDSNTEKTHEQTIGEATAVVAPEDGVVKKITSGELVLKTASGIRRIGLYNNFILNRKSYLHHTPIVKVGDTVKKGQLLAESNYSKNGTLALGVNLKTAYVPYAGYNHDDGIVITESAAHKLTSNHVHNKALDLDGNTLLGLNVFRTQYPSAISPQNLKKLDDTGVIKKGERVEMGDTVIAALRKREPSKDIGVIQRQLSDRPRDASVHWTYEDTGEVIDVQRSSKGIVVFIKTEEHARVGDKLSGRHGNKGVITRIIPDAEAPHNAQGEAVEMLLNPHGVISRINIGQIYESAAAKVAKKRGVPHVVKNFSGEDYLRSTQKLLSENNVDDKEELFDPKTGKSLGRVHVGNPYTLKLFKLSQGNYSVRQGGPGHPYDTNLQPLRAGGEDSAKALDLLTMYAMLSHGARANLREMATAKSNQNDEYWAALKSGQPLPPPKSPFVYDKFLSYLKGAGINVDKKGSTLTLAPLTDAEVKKQSSGEVKNPFFYRAKDMQPVPGGFLDPVKLGGFKGTKWGHLELKEPVVNPIFEKAVKKITGLGSRFEELMAGRMHLDKHGVLNTEGRGATGGHALETLLKKIDVDKSLKEALAKAATAKGATLDDLNKKIRYLQALKKYDLKPHEAYLRKVVPVLPPIYRPIYSLPDGNTATSDLNLLYQNIGVLNTVHKLPVVDLLAEEDKAPLREDIYKHIQALSGLTDLNIKGKPREGFISEIRGGSGGQPKEGLFISKVLKKRLDYAGRGTAIPEPSLGIDEIAIPDQMAWKLFEPFVVRELRKFGKTPNQALDEIEKKSDLARRALEIVMKDRKILMNRAPSLHKFSIMAFRPRTTTGTAIKVPPLINAGFNLDFDGDAVSLHLPISDEANKEAEKMLPSQNLYKPGTGKLMYVPTQEAQIGIYYLSKTPAGRERLNQILGKTYAINHVLDKNATQELLLKISKELKPDAFGSIVTALKAEGEKHAYEKGFTLGVNDLVQFSKERDALVSSVSQHLPNIKSQKGLGDLNRVATEQMDKAIEKKLKDKDNPLFDMIESGAKGSKSQLRSILATPLLVTDAKGRIVPVPIRKSYSEGLDMADYWTSMYGARRGMMDRAVQTKLPGAFSKDIMASTIDNVITAVDCGTKKGVPISADSPDALERFTSEDQYGVARNTLVDSQLIAKFKKAGAKTIKVRSPLTCLQPKGTCAKCYGLDEHGSVPAVGENVGAKAGQTISEPLVQLVLNTFHTGGTAGTGADVGGYKRIDQLLKLPRIVHGAAALAPVTGSVTKITPGVAGGYDVTVQDKTVHVAQGRALKVKVGSQVTAGDPLSEGAIKPQDLVKLKGMQPAQEYIVDELHKAYGGQGVKLHRKVFETIVRSLGNTTQVLNNPKHTDFVPGDIIPYTVAQHYNENLATAVPVEEALGHKLVTASGPFRPGHVVEAKDLPVLRALGHKEITVEREPLQHAPLLKGVKALPLLKKNWMSALGYQHLAKALTEGAGQAWSTDLEDYHPIPAFAHGATFGQGKDGKY